MRPPRWPTLTPPPVPRDIHEFKLPLVPTFLCAETPDQEEKRRRLVRREALRFYQMVAEHLGEEDARKLFCLFISNPRRGSPGGSLDAELRQRLLAEYDKRCANALRYKSQGAKNIKARLARDLAPELGKKPDTVRKASTDSWPNAPSTLRSRSEDGRCLKLVMDHVRKALRTRTRN
jgi:hypothetical protein